MKWPNRSILRQVCSNYSPLVLLHYKVADVILMDVLMWVLVWSVPPFVELTRSSITCKWNLTSGTLWIYMCNFSFVFFLFKSIHIKSGDKELQSISSVLYVEQVHNINEISSFSSHFLALFWDKEKGGERERRRRRGRKNERKQVQDNVSVLITPIHSIDPYGLFFTHVIPYAPSVFYHIFNDLDYLPSDNTNNDVIPRHRHEQIQNDFGLLDDDSEDNFTILGKRKRD